MKHRLENAGTCFFGQLCWAGGSIVALYWLIESAAHSFWFQDGPLFAHVFKPDAHEIWMRFIVTLLLLFFIFYCHQIIIRLHQAKAELKEREEEAVAILENTPAAILLLDVASRTISYANRNAQQAIGLPHDKLRGSPCRSFFCQDQLGDRCPVLDLHQEVATSEKELLTSTGATVPILKSIASVHYDGRPHLLETFFDISEQKRIQQAIHDAHSELDQIFQTASVGMRLIDQNYTILKVNRSFADLCGISPEKAVGSKCYDIFAGNMCNGVTCPLRTALEGRELKEYEVSKIRADGSVLTCSLTVARFEGADGITGIVESFKDISDLKRTEYQLQAERDRLHNILFHQFEAVGIITEAYVLEYRNEILKEYTGEQHSRLCYEIFRDSTSPCSDCLMHQAHESKEIQRCEYEAPSGKSYEYTYTPFVDNDSERKVVISQRDITEAKASKAAAISSERLAGLGELAAGVAHEINNPINGIINYAQILVNNSPPDSRQNTIAGWIIREGDRIAAIVSSLLSFSRQGGDKRQSANIADLLREALTLTGAQLRKDNIRLRVDLAEEIPQVFVVPHNIVQVFINLINNSRYSLNERYARDNEGKSLEISIHRLSESDQVESIRIVLTDNGTGIPPDLLGRVLNPFFSTKPKGKGTGLGLTLSHRIIEDHGGTLMLDSLTRSFTRVTITLPAHLPDSGDLHHEREYSDS